MQILLLILALALPAQAARGGRGAPSAAGPSQDATQPRAISRVQAQYTAAAMRAGIEGSVVLGCMIGEDGSVRDCEVVRSLDAANGLDQAAIDAAKQWRYEPATQGGVPVAVRATIEMSFRIPAPERWPAAFTHAEMPATAGWTETRVALQGFAVTVLHSPDWQETTSAAPPQPTGTTGGGVARAAAAFRNAKGGRTMVVFPARPLPEPAPSVLGVSDMRRIAEASQQDLPKGAERIGFGTVRTPSGPTVWAEIYIPAAAMAAQPNLPPDLQELKLGPSAGARVWSFFLLNGSSMIPISFAVDYPAGKSDDENAPLGDAAAAEFQRMMLSLRVSAN
jgi:protein TonB